MSKISVYNLSGKKVKEINLSEGVFAAPRNDALLHQVYVAQYANKRSAIAHTKDRAERSGSGKKPWKQKGTGNARVGSSRTPVWRKGGVVFGPTKDRNFKKNINKKMKRKAVIVALSDKVRSGNLVVLENFNLKNKKTKEFAKALISLKIKGTALVGLSEKEKEVYRYCRNIDKVRPISASNLSVLDVLNCKNLLLSQESVKFLEEKHGSDKKSKDENPNQVKNSNK